MSTENDVETNIWTDSNTSSGITIDGSIYLDQGTRIQGNYIKTNPKGGEKLDIKDIQDFKKLTPDEKVTYILDNANSKAEKLLAMWVRSLEEKIK